MSNRFTKLICLALLAMLIAGVFLVAGCSDTHADEQPAAAETAATYKAGHGLQVSKLARDFNGVKTAEFQQVLREQALIRTVEGSFVYVENGDWLLRTPVRVTAAPTGGFRVDDGLYEGDVIVTDGAGALWLAELHFLRAGQACAHGD